MVIEIVTTGTELLLGQVVNTNAAFLAAEFNRIGMDVLYQSTVGDNRARMKETLAHAFARADIVVTSGGLGPTQGDITKEVAAELFGRSLSLHEESMARIRAYFDQRLGARMADSNVRQAMIPEGAHVFANHCGTAPGIALEVDGKLLICLPGPPFELKDMVKRSVLPYLLEKYGAESVIVSRVLRTAGIGESALEEAIRDLILAQENPTLALLARPDAVIVRITAKDTTAEAARARIAPMEAEIRRRLGAHVFGVDDERMESVVGALLAKKRLTVATAESCTGGLVASRLTDVAGSSRYVRGAAVTYTNESKGALLGVSEQTLAEKGAVSAETAAQMAEGVRSRFGADFGVSTTGVAGPEPSEGKPVGLVYVAVAGPLGVRGQECHLGGGRKAVKFRASQAALDLLRRYIEEL